MSLREQKAAKKKEDMIKSAVSIISEKGYHATTMEDIASKLLMTKGSVYYYFKDKQDLLFQSQKMLLEQSIAHIEKISNEDLQIIEKLRKTMLVHIEYLITERTGFAMGVKPEQFFIGGQLAEILRLRNQYSEYIDDLLHVGIEQGVFAEVDIKIVRNIILGAMNWVIEWYSPHGQKDKKGLAQSISMYLLRMLIKQ
ncbi:TetR/AcrR family transcriptional regulator [Lentibacillus sp. N15]|uniref:TetR/AcrR family transcriptional regulator n=1 Tax=Lentibacillus songyuanensis TaxID=3136161 RepID=UPI0031BBA05D